MITPTIAVQRTINHINRFIIGRLTCMLHLVCALVRARLFQVLKQCGTGSLAETYTCSSKVNVEACQVTAHPVTILLQNVWDSFTGN